MRKSSVIAAAVASAALTIGSVGIFASTAFASAINGTTHGSPAGTVVLAGPAPVPLPPNCPAFLSTDSWLLFFTGGNSVNHGTQNKNGDWGGSTEEGPAVLVSSVDSPEYAGHLTQWGGGGQNSDPGGTSPTGQNEGGTTINFDGTGPAGSISIHANFHTTVNNNGAPTANVTNITVVCG